MSVTQQFLERVREYQARIAREEAGRIAAAARLIADCVAGGGLVHVIGPGGHSMLAAEECFYRAGGLVYNASTMEKSKKGWYTALIPGGKIAGKVLQYYVEARNGRQDVVGANGRANSPNIAAIRPPKSR